MYTAINFAGPSTPGSSVVCAAAVSPYRCHGLYRRVSVRASISTFPADSVAIYSAAANSKRLSLYEILRVKETASPREIRAAYRSLAKRYHPDAVRQSDGRDFIEIHNAYETLSDPAARAVYDLSLMSAAAEANPFEWMRARRASVHSPSRRWETDQCW